MISDYASLRSAVGDFMQRDDLIDMIPYFVQEAEARMNELRVWRMETALDLTISSSVIAVPADYLALKNAYVNSSSPVPLQRVTATVLYEKYPIRSNTGVPRLIAREATNFIFGPAPDSDYNIKGIYYARPAALSADTSTNWAITYYPMYMLYESLSCAEPYVRNDQRLQTWKAMAGQHKATIKKDERAESISGSAPRARSA